MSGSLTSHVLDTMRGLPAVGMVVELWRPGSGARQPLWSGRTDGAGRTAPIELGGSGFPAGVYELVFHVDEYFAAQGVEPAGLAFLGAVPVRFGIADVTAGYHIPLLICPWAYTTYRGS